MGNFELRNSISLIPIVVNKGLHPSHANYKQILLTNEKQIIKEPVAPMGSLDKQLELLYYRHIATSFEWPIIRLADCRKVGTAIEVTYTVQMIMVDGCINAGKLINIKDFFDLQMEEYYGRIISRTN